MNFPVHILNGECHFQAKFHQLIDAYKLVLLAEHEVLRYTRRTRSAAAWLPDYCTRLADSRQQTINASKFPTLVDRFTQQPSCTISLLHMDF